MMGGRFGGENRWAWLVVGAVVLVSVLVYLNRPAPSESIATDRTRPAPSAETSSAQVPTGLSAEESASPDAAAAPDPSPTSLPELDLKLPEGVVPPGLGGSGEGWSLSRATISIRITSTSPLHKISYIIPTSDDSPYGEENGVGTTWSHRTKVWGKPDYAAVFVHALYPGVKVSCVITVNGRVTERRTIVGPYAAMWCQG